MGHTTEPWAVDFNGKGRFIVHGRADDRVNVCRVAEGVESQANAQLIAAAPELLEACKIASKCLDLVATLCGGLTQGTDADTLAARRAMEIAIAKAEGVER